MLNLWNILLLYNFKCLKKRFYCMDGGKTSEKFLFLKAQLHSGNRINIVSQWVSPTFMIWHQISECPSISVLLCFGLSRLLMHLEIQWRRSKRTCIPATRMWHQNGVPESWIWPGSTPSVVIQLERELADGRPLFSLPFILSLSLPSFLPCHFSLSLYHSNK